MKTQTFSEFYQRWLGESRIVDEAQATCGACAMIDSGYSPDLKCCTYFPFLPNFAIGAILEVGEDGQTRHLERAIAKGKLTPLGLFASDEYQRLKEAAGNAGFGRRRELLCPFFDSGARACSIWAFRPAVCASYFCQSKRHDSWRKIEAYANQFEWTLAHDVLWRMGFTRDETRRMAAEEAWFEYASNKSELFRGTYRTACEISKGEVLELMGEPMLEL